jgi:hypothetical protein
VATFNRAPDAAGLSYWLNDSGLQLEEIAQSFFDQPETQEKYPPGSTNEEFVMAVYNNLFNRDPEPAGLEYWVEELNSGRVAKPVFILAVINGAQNTELGNDAIILDNKTIVGLAFADAGLDDVELAIEIMSGITDDYASVNAALETLLPNNPPIADAGADQNAEVGQAITITGSATDSDGTIVSYEWTKDSDALATSASFDYIPTIVGTDTLTLTVMDDDGATGNDSMNVVVVETLPINQPPIAYAGIDKNVEVDQEVILDGSGSSDPESNPLTYLWTFLSKPTESSATLSNSTTVNANFVPDEIGTYEIQLTVNDGSLTDSDSVIITATSSTTTVSFENDVWPIFVSNCSSCHSTTSKRTFKVGDVAYTYNNIIVNNLINTTSPDLSPILIKGNGGDGHSGGDHLTSVNSQTVRDWIEQGGLNN